MLNALGPHSPDPKVPRTGRKALWPSSAPLGVSMGTACSTVAQLSSNPESAYGRL